MSECENITMIKYKVDDEEFEDTIITTFADWKSFQVNLQQNTVICNKIFNISHRHNIVSLTGSEVTHVETEFLKNQELVQIVKITATKIQTIRKHTFKDLEVERLILDENQISVIEEEAFFNLPLLNAIQINGNRLGVLNSNSFKNLPIMATFHAQHNKIKSLENSFFQIIKKDNGHVSLIYNKLNVLKKDFFAGLSVENMGVKLGVNQIKELPVGIFDGYSFKFLDLSHNLITDISEEFLQDCVRIQVICFDKNVFNGVTLRRIQIWSRRNNITVNYFPNALIRNGAAGKFLSFVVTAAVFGFVMLSPNI
jgi:Leucine-rich repeat (LRR) protein